MTEISLLPSDYKQKLIEAKKGFRVFLIFFLILGLFFIALLFLYQINRILDSNLGLSDKEISLEKQRIKSYEDIEVKVKKLNELLKAVNDLQKSRIFWMRILKELASSTPPKLQIEQLSLDPGKSPSLTISGIGQTQREVAKLAEKLEASPIFTEVVVISVSSSGEKEVSGFKFQFTANLEKVK